MRRVAARKVGKVYVLPLKEYRLMLAVVRAAEKVVYRYDQLQDAFALKLEEAVDAFNAKGKRP